MVFQVERESNTTEGPRREKKKKNKLKIWTSELSVSDGQQINNDDFFVLTFCFQQFSTELITRYQTEICEILPKIQQKHHLSVDLFGVDLCVYRNYLKIDRLLSSDV